MAPTLSLPKKFKGCLCGYRRQSKLIRSVAAWLETRRLFFFFLNLKSKLNLCCGYSNQFPFLFSLLKKSSGFQRPRQRSFLRNSFLNQPCSIKSGDTPHPVCCAPRARPYIRFAHRYITALASLALALRAHHIPKVFLIIST